MQKKVVNNIALAATVLLVPGGFILGAALVARHYRKVRAARSIGEAGEEPPGPIPEPSAETL